MDIKEREAELKDKMGGVKKEVASLKTCKDNMDYILTQILKTKSLEVSKLSQAHSPSPRPRGCLNCGQFGHFLWDCKVKRPSVSFAATEDSGNLERLKSEAISDLWKRRPTISEYLCN